MSLCHKLLALLLLADDEDEDKNSDTDQAKLLRDLINQASRYK